jgi:3'-phosphoadenosine 5'-phosphosulfate sulfotransferase (PAPS reductase)/FAD synthetase
MSRAPSSVQYELGEVLAALPAPRAHKLSLVLASLPSVPVDPCRVYAFEPTPSACNPFAYDTWIVAFSGGKDSLALVLLLLLLGVPRERIELWHHDVDGREGSTLMDWPCTRDYCAGVAAAFGLAIYFSWKVGGFEGEMLRHDSPTAGYLFETPDGGLESAGGTSSKTGTREMFPQKHHSLTVRWCSAYTKIMVMGVALRNQERFMGQRTLVLSGERAEESPKRAEYEVWERHRDDLRDGQRPRMIDHWRPLHGWLQAEVWALIEKFRVNPHPAYRLGWGRVSCARCIFGSPNQWASVRAITPRAFQRIADYERAFGKTIDREKSVVQMADEGRPFEGMREEDIRAALSMSFDEPVFLDHWTLPAGAHGDVCGPT